MKLAIFTNHSIVMWWASLRPVGRLRSVTILPLAVRSCLKKMILASCWFEAPIGAQQLDDWPNLKLAFGRVSGLCAVCSVSNQTEGNMHNRDIEKPEHQSVHVFSLETNCACCNSAWIPEWCCIPPHPIPEKVTHLCDEMTYKLHAKM